MRYVRYPGSVWSVSCELSSYQIRCRRLGGILPGSSYLAAAVNTLDTGLAHETGYPLAAHTYTLEAQFGVNAGSTIGAP